MKPSEIGSHLAALEHDLKKRSLVAYRAHGEKLSVAGGPNLENFSSNDYLGLSREPMVVVGAQRALEQYGAGNPSSRLVCGHNELFENLETRLAKFKGTEAALIMPSGYAANLSLMTAVTDLQTTVLVDRLGHASLIDGMRASGSPFERFVHNDLGDLSRRLGGRKTPDALVATESVFSMDGDRAPLAEIDEICQREGHWFLVDEAHSTGVYGQGGAGLARDLPAGAPHRLVMGTFGKALGGFGAFVACTQGVKELLLNRARPFIFTTALPPSVLGGVGGALDFLEANPHVGADLLRRCGAFRKNLEAQGVPVVPGDSPIVAVVCGANDRALALSAHLKDRGFLGVAIRPPTVPRGQARVRLTVCRFHTEKQLDALGLALKEFFQKDPS